MVSKKYTLLAVLFCLLASYGMSQTTTGSGYDVADSLVVSSKRLPQYTEFMNGTYNFPPKPKNQWEIGFKYGVFQIIGDVPSVFLTAPNFGVHIRKALGYTFSLRLEYLNAVGKGLDWRYSQNYGKNKAWSQYYNAPVRTNNNVVGTLGSPNFDKVYYNYKTQVQDLSLQAVVNFTNILFHKATVKTNVYGFAGVGAVTYKTSINALNGTTPYTAAFNSLAQVTYDNRKDALDALKDVLDDSYETKITGKGEYGPQLGNNPLRATGVLGLGIAFKLSNRVNLAVENRWNVIKDDLLDGQQWQEQTWGDASVTQSPDTYTFTSVGLNINIGGRSRVQPLYWLNPLEYAYQEIRKPRLMILPKPVLPDADGDGVTDQFDREQTPAGAPVDTHGVSRDTDGDGVPDYKDKELVTPTYCQPVDADGVGKCPVPCPDPSCFPKPPVSECATQLGALPSVSFRPNSTTLTTDAKAVLATVAGKLRNAPECKVVVVGYGSTSKAQQQLSWDHVNTVINYLVENEGISSDRFIFKYGEDGPNDTVDIHGAGAGEDGPNTVAPPHPNLQKK
jgi:outer membrane protein OmpA-like peptidoglycan-associated protein